MPSKNIHGPTSRPHASRAPMKDFILAAGVSGIRSQFRKSPVVVEPPPSLDTSRRLKTWTLVVPFVDLSDSSPHTWIVTTKAQTSQEAWGKFSQLLNDSKKVLRTLAEDDSAVDGLPGPDYLEDYGLRLGTPFLLETLEAPRWTGTRLMP